MVDERYDSLDGWRKENGIKTSKGEVKHYEGGCEYDATYEAIMGFIKEQERKEKRDKSDNKINEDLQK